MLSFLEVNRCVPSGEVLHFNAVCSHKNSIREKAVFTT